MSKEFAIYNRLVVDIVQGKFVKRVEIVQVRVMARAEGYALVRRKRAMPFVVCEKDLVKVESPKAGQQT